MPSIREFHRSARRSPSSKNRAVRREFLCAPRSRGHLDQADPRAQFPNVTTQVKLQVTPDGVAVFVGDGFVGTVREFGEVGRAMLVSLEHRMPWAPNLADSAFSQTAFIRVKREFLRQQFRYAEQARF